MLKKMFDIIEGLWGTAVPAMRLDVDRRERPRVSVDEEIRGKLLDAKGTPFSAVVRDASPKGVRIVSDRPLPVSMPLQFQRKEVLFFGEVIHCSPSEEGYTVGVQLLQYLDLSSIKSLGL